MSEHTILFDSVNGDLLLSDMANLKSQQNQPRESLVTKSPSRTEDFRGLVQASGWSVDEIAKRLDVERSYPYHLINGTRVPSQRLLNAMRALVDEQQKGTEGVIDEDARKKLDSEAEAGIRRISAVIAEQDHETQRLLVKELGFSFAQILRLAVKFFASTCMALGYANSSRAEIVRPPSGQARMYEDFSEFVSANGTSIPLDPNFIEKMKFGYWFDKVNGKPSLHCEVIELHYQEEKSKARGSLTFAGTGSHSGPEGRRNFKIEATLISKAAFGLIASQNEGLPKTTDAERWGFIAVFNTRVENVLLGNWAGLSSNTVDRMLWPDILSAVPLEEKAWAAPLLSYTRR